MIPSRRTDLESILAADTRLPELRHQIYRFVALNFQKISQLTSVREQDWLSDELRLRNREWEIWWPIEVVMDWVDVPPNDRELARSFYRGAIPSVKAELPDIQRAVVAALIEQDESAERIAVNSLHFPPRVAAHLLDDHQESLRQRIGEAVRDLGILIESGRCRLDGRKVTQWRVDLSKTRRFAEAYGIEP